MISKKKIGLLLLEIFAIIVFIIFISPLFLVIMNAAKSNGQIILDPLAIPENWGLLFQNVKSVLSDRAVNYSSSFISSVIITICSLITITIISSMCAWSITRNKSKFSTIVYLMFVAAMVIPFQVIMFPLVSWFRTLSQNVTLPLMGFNLLRSYPGMILAYTGFGMAMSVFMLSGFIKGIPVTIEQAAEIDGASKWQVFIYIILPMLKPIIVTVVILNGIWIWNDFLLPLLILGKGNAIQTLPLAVSNFAGAYTKQWDLILTSTLLAIVPVLIVFLFGQKHIIKGMTDGAIKS